MLKKPIVNTIWQILGKGLTVGVSLVTTGILTRMLGSKGYGELVLISSVFIFLDSLADFGTKIIGVRELTKGRRVFWQTGWLRLMMTGVAFTAGLTLILFWDGFSQIRTEAVVALLMIWLTSMAGSVEIVMQSRMRMDLKTIMDVAYPLLFLIGIIGWQARVNLMGVFWGYLAARAVSLGIGIVLIRPISPIKKIDWKKIKYLLGESWPMGMYLIVFAAYDRAVDSMMIERLVGIREVAWYGLAYKIYSNLVQPAYFLVVSVFPLLSARGEEKKKIFGETMRWLLGGAVGVMVVVGVMAPKIIEILGGSDFGPAVGVLRVLMGALFFAYIQHLIGFSLISRGGQKELLGVGLATLVFNIGANWWLIPRWGMMGAAGVTGATEALATGLMWWRWRGKR